MPEITGKHKPQEEATRGAGAEGSCSVLESVLWRTELDAPHPRGGALLHFQPGLINDRVSLSCKKTGSVFQGHKFSQRSYVSSVCKTTVQEPLGLAVEMDARTACGDLSQAVCTASSSRLRGCGARSALRGGWWVRVWDHLQRRLEPRPFLASLEASETAALETQPVVPGFSVGCVSVCVCVSARASTHFLGHCFAEQI